MRTCLILVLTLLSQCTFGQAAAQDWPQFRGPGATGVVESPGQPVKWDKENGSLWRLYPGTGATGRLTVRYQVFANDLSGTFSVLDTAHANWNGGSLFMYVVGHKADPVVLSVDAPPGWMLVSGDSRDPLQREFTFENYDRLIDTPTEVAPNVSVDSFRVDGRLYRVMVHHNGLRTRLQQQRFVDNVKRIVETENRVIAPPPLERYTFLFLGPLRRGCRSRPSKLVKALRCRTTSYAGAEIISFCASAAIP